MNVVEMAFKLDKEYKSLNFEEIEGLQRMDIKRIFEINYLSKEAKDLQNRIWALGLVKRTRPHPKERYI